MEWQNVPDMLNDTSTRGVFNGWQWHPLADLPEDAKLRFDKLIEQRQLGKVQHRERSTKWPMLCPEDDCFTVLVSKRSWNDHERRHREGYI
jgi:hypothetical protein